MANRYPVIVTNTGAGDTAPFAFKEIPSGDDLLLTGNFIRIGSTSASAAVIKDANGNAVISFPTAVASAVNYFQLSNSATANSIVLEALGGDASVSIHIKPKGADGEIIVGTGAAAAVIETSGNQNLVLRSGNSTTGSLTLTQGNNGDLTFTPAGAGKLKVGTNNVVVVGDTGTVSSGMIADTAISTAKIQDSAITSGKIAATAVSTAKIEDLAVSTNKIAAGAVTNAKIADTAVGTSKIEDLAVTTNKIAATAVTNAKIADTAVSTTKIEDLAVTTAKIAATAVTSAKIADSAITASKIDLSGGGTLTLSTNSTTGLKIGGATTQMLGFYNATPVVRQTAPASAASNANTTTLATAVNSIRTALINLGLVG